MLARDDAKTHKKVQISMTRQAPKVIIKYSYLSIRDISAYEQWKGMHLALLIKQKL